MNRLTRGYEVFEVRAGGLSRKVTAERQSTWPGWSIAIVMSIVWWDDEESRELFIAKIPEAANTGKLLEQDGLRREEDSLGCSNIDFPAGCPGKETEVAVAWGRRPETNSRSHPQEGEMLLGLWSNAASLGVFLRQWECPGQSPGPDRGF